MNMVQCVIGMLCSRPPMLRMSCSPLMAWITEPAPRNSSALKNACVNTWKTPAANAPTPSARNIYPSCDTVEYASTRLMSFCTKPIDAAKIAVSAPIDRHHLHRRRRQHETAHSSAPPCTRRRSPWSPRGSARRPASGLPSRPAATHKEEAAPTSRRRRRTAAARPR